MTNPTPAPDDGQQKARCELCDSGYPKKQDASGWLFHHMGGDQWLECETQSFPADAEKETKIRNSVIDECIKAYESTFVYPATGNQYVVIERMLALKGKAQK